MSWALFVRFSWGTFGTGFVWGKFAGGVLNCAFCLCDDDEDDFPAELGCLLLLTVVNEIELGSDTPGVEIGCRRE